MLDFKRRVVPRLFYCCAPQSLFVVRVQDVLSDTRCQAGFAALLHKFYD